MKNLRLGLAAALAALFAAPSLHAETIFAGGYPDTLAIFDTDSGEITQRITLATGLPRSMRLSADGKLLYLTSINSGIEVVDVATKKSLAHFQLDTPTRRYRFHGGVLDSTGRYFYLIGEHFDKLNDRYKVSKPQYIVADVQEKNIVLAVDIEEDDVPKDSWRQQLLLSPDDKTLYVIGEKIVVLNAADLKVTKRIDLAKTDIFEDGRFGRGGLESLSSPNEYVSLFNASQGPIHAKMFGIARFNLTTQQIDFKPIGPAPEAMAGLQVTPDGEEAYTVVTNGKGGRKRCEFWRFNLADNMVLDKREFECRSRFSFGMSADGRKLYIYGASYDIEVYDARTLKYDKTWQLGFDNTSAGIIAIN